MKLFLNTGLQIRRLQSFGLQIRNDAGDEQQRGTTEERQVITNPKYRGCPQLPL